MSRNIENKVFQVLKIKAKTFAKDFNFVWDLRKFGTFEGIQWRLGSVVRDVGSAPMCEGQTSPTTTWLPSMASMVKREESPLFQQQISDRNWKMPFLYSNVTKKLVNRFDSNKSDMSCKYVLQLKGRPNDWSYSLELLSKMNNLFKINAILVMDSEKYIFKNRFKKDLTKRLTKISKKKNI